MAHGKNQEKTRSATLYQQAAHKKYVMATLPDTRKIFSSHIPALQMLISMGYMYLPPSEITKKRNGNINDVLLREVLITELRKRRFTWNNKEYSLSNNAIDEIICQFTPPELDENLLTVNEYMYDRLISGITVTELIDNKKIQPTIHVIDWHNTNNNQFHVTDAFEILNAEGTNAQRLDIVCFINGIPIVIIETRHSDSQNSHKDMIKEGISQHIRNQSITGIPSLYACSQLLFSVNGRDGRYGTTRTPRKFWALWRDEEFDTAVFNEIKNRVLHNNQKARLFAHRPAWMSDYFDKFHAQGGLLSTGQDRLIISLLRPDRLLAFIQFFILFDKKNGKLVARYQQYFAVRRLMKRVCQKNMQGEREGGVLWHTTGSGKSFAMAFAAKTLIQHEALKQCRFVVITDCTDLESRLSHIFTNTNTLAMEKNTRQAKAATGKNLAERIGNGKERVLFSMIKKFTTAARRLESHNLDQNIIVLVDEGCNHHDSKTYARMRRMLPNASFIIFTGTPLLRKDKTTNPFGPVIHTYTIQQAIDDGVITPLLYEERIPASTAHIKTINHRPVHITEKLTTEQKANIKIRLFQKKVDYHSDSRIALIAHDISEHFVKNIPAGMKGQLATDSKLSAIRYKKILDNIGQVSSEVVISSPNTHEGNTESNENLRSEIQQWWRLTVGNLHDAAYAQKIMRQFVEKDHPQLLIVVDRLLTNINEPRNAVLYIDKTFKNQAIIQASAGINRRHRLKKFGLLVDYRGVLSALDMTLKTNPKQEVDFDSDDLTGLYRQTNTEYKKLLLLHKRVWGLFKNVKNRKNPENLRKTLSPHYKEDAGIFFDCHQSSRENFYKSLQDFSSCLEIALGSANFHKENYFTEKNIKAFRNDLIFFTDLKYTVQRDADEIMDCSRSTAYIKKFSTKYLANKHIQEPTSIYFGDTLIKKNIPKNWPVEKIKNKINSIRIKIKKTINQDLQNDPYARKVFLERLNEDNQESEEKFDFYYKKYLFLENLEKQIKNKAVPDIPKELMDQLHARAYYGVFKIILNNGETDDFSDDENQTYISHALMIDKTVNKAIAEHSLNRKNLESEIRGKLLPPIFKKTGIKKAKKIIEQIIQIIPSDLKKPENPR